MNCPNCGYEFDAHTCINNKKAKVIQDGDISICLRCREVHQLNNGVLELIDIKCLPIEAQNDIKRIIAIMQLVEE